MKNYDQLIHYVLYSNSNSIPNANKCVSESELTVFCYICHHLMVNVNNFELISFCCCSFVVFGFWICTVIFYDYAIYSVNGTLISILTILIENVWRVVRLVINGMISSMIYYSMALFQLKPVVVTPFDLIDCYSHSMDLSIAVETILLDLCYYSMKREPNVNLGCNCKLGANETHTLHWTMFVVAMMFFHYHCRWLSVV